MTERRGPAVFEIDDDAPAPNPAEAPPPADPLPTDNAAMARAARFAARPRSRLARWFWAALTGFIGLAVSVTAWDFVTSLLDRSPVLGTLAAAFAVLAVLILLAMALREAAAFARLSRIDAIQEAARHAVSARDLAAARGVVDRLEALYRARPDLEWARAQLAERRGDPVDADALLALAERHLMAPLDAAARAEVEAAARTVATVTAVVPLALADVAAALFSNLRMIRRLAEIYGGRAGAFGAWRLTRAVLGHLAATGAVAVGDDLVGSVAGGSALSRLSRRFGEGLVNGALTARVGLAAMEVCRPLPFAALPRPRTSSLVKRALTGVFSSDQPATSGPKD